MLSDMEFRRLKLVFTYVQIFQAEKSPINSQVTTENTYARGGTG